MGQTWRQQTADTSVVIVLATLVVSRDGCPRRGQGSHLRHRRHRCRHRRRRRRRCGLGRWCGRGRAVCRM